MIFEDEKLLRERIEYLLGRRAPGRIIVSEDTTDYFRISTGTVLRVEGCDYFVLNEAREGRFGIDEQPKHWVKYALDLEDGSRKIIKLVFLEQFVARLGPFTARCTRNPDKESRILKLVCGDRRFMQGKTVRDRLGNNIRILEIIRGKSLYSLIADLDEPHPDYFRNTLPSILTRIDGAIEALELLHENNEHHGDVRNDHIIVERDSGEFRWIDFDYEVNFLDYDLWSVGNLLTYAVGQGIRTIRPQEQSPEEQRDRSRPIEAEDAMLFFNYRLANLRKIFPYIPRSLNDMLMRFSAHTTNYYHTLAEVREDLDREITRLSAAEPAP
jgi:hypothetical protein